MEFEKSYCHFRNQCPRIFYHAELRALNTYLQKYLHLRQKLVYFGIFVQQLEKAIVLFEIIALEFV